MRTRAEVDREIASEKQALASLKRSQYIWTKTKDREKRDEWIMELWEMGLSYDEIAERVEITPQRVGQVVRGFGR